MENIKEDKRKSPIAKERARQNTLRRWADPAYRARLGASQKKSYEEHPTRKAKQLEHLRSDKMRGIASETMKKHWEDKKKSGNQEKAEVPIDAVTD